MHDSVIGKMGLVYRSVFSRTGVVRIRSQWPPSHPVAGPGEEDCLQVGLGSQEVPSVWGKEYRHTLSLSSFHAFSERKVGFPRRNVAGPHLHILELFTRENTARKITPFELFQNAHITVYLFVFSSMEA